MQAAEIEEQKTEARAEKRGAAVSALAHRNFRLFWAGGFLSNVGTWMQALAQGWLMYELTHSAFWLGFDGFCATAPAIILTPLGGVFADILDRRRMLLASQVVAGASALVLSLVIWTNLVRFPMILAASLVTGCCFALASPAYQAFIIELVGRKDLSNAIALNSAQFQLSRVLGPVLAGLAFRFVGVAGCFFVNGISYVAIVGALAMVRLPKRGAAAATRPADSTTAGDEPVAPTTRDDVDAVNEHEREIAAALSVSEGAREIGPAATRPAISRQDVWRDLKEGFRYMLGRPRVFTLLVISSVTSVFGAPYMTMMPLFARDVFHLDASGLSIMMGVAGAGAFFGAVGLALLGDVRRKGLFVLGGTLTFGACVVGFALSTTLVPALVFLFLIGFGIVSSIAVVNMLLQHLVTDEMRGRVMSMFMLSFFGAFPVGNLLVGVTAPRYGAPHTLAVGGAVIVVFAAAVALFNPRLRALD
ncbi:MAG: MFS transporter [Acidobacteria bacterium]|nr:MFS transporter [Acidobacteriota bacterium]